MTPLLEELREARPAAPPALRDQVRALAADEPEPKSRRLPRRRLVLSLAAAALVGAAAAGAVVALTRQERQPVQPVVLRGATAGSAAETTPAPPRVDSAKSRLGPVVLPPSSSRLQNYGASLRLQVPNANVLSDRTKQAMQIARSLGGFVSSVDFNSGGRNGSATLVLRVPTTKLPVAVERLSRLGRILAQHVSIVDVQKRIDTLRQKVQESTGDTRKTAEQQLQRELRRARLSSIAVALTTPPPVVALPHRESPLVRVLEVEGQIALYGLVIGGPILLLLALLWLGARAARRRAERRLLGA